MEKLNLREFIKENSYEFSDGFEPKGNSIGCIDDRADEPGSQEKIALPGGGLGILFSVFNCISLLKKKYGENIKVDIEKISQEVENITGISIHTDEKNVQENNPVLCGGCGHCSGMLKNHDLSDDFHSFTLNSYLPKLKEEGVQPVVYRGSHNADGVVIIEDLKTGLRSKSSKGQVFVYNKNWHHKILEEASKVIFENLKGEIPGLKQEEVSSTLLTQAEKELEKTIDHLASSLPKISIP
ncbi:MAG TPA: hypothetical protein PKZ36_02320 [Candidatus Paceibacterota bacterium]|nr:hypothetical protein [Candidatus Paceibacterota bacterium]HPT18217.1 hypothetical protein [Candidatus Paceibacterota bacterium]